jgi:predicted transcriptional regulator
LKHNENTLDLKNRRQIFTFIRKYPGTYLRKLSRKLDIPKTTLIYHLDYLEKRGYTEKKNDGKYTRYYITQNVGTIEKKLLHLFRQEITRNIILLLLLQNSPPKRIISELKHNPRTINSNLKKLIDMEIVNRVKVYNQIQYRLKDPEIIIDFLYKYKDTLSNDGVLSKYGIREVLNRMEYGIPKKGVDALIEMLYDIFPHPYHP